jgi:hypothetical protein
MGFTKQNQKKITKRNEILLMTKQNETKQYEISLLLLFRETREISQKKGCEMETPTVNISYMPTANFSQRVHIEYPSVALYTTENLFVKTVPSTKLPISRS